MEGEIIQVKVKPNSSKNQVLEDNGVYCVHVKSPAEKGKANQELVKVLSKHFKKKAAIIAGFKSRNKRVLLR